MSLLLAAPAKAQPGSGDSRIEEWFEWSLDTAPTGTRVRPQAGASFVFGPSGGVPAAASPSDPRQSLARLSAPGEDWIRVRVDGPAVRVALYLRQGDLAPLARRPALLAPTRAAARRGGDDDSPGVHLEVGAPLAVGAGRGGVRRASLAPGDLRASGFVASDAVGIEFAPRPRPRVRGGTWVSIPGDTRLRARPGGGAVVATLARSGRASVRVLERRGRHALVAYRGEWGDAVGWIAGDIGSPVIVSDILGGLGLRGSSSRQIALPPGSLLAGRRGGEPVGLVTRSRRFAVRSRDGDWIEISASSEIGDLSLWTRSDWRVRAPSSRATPRRLRSLGKK